jgi:hypothetical protein
MLLTRSLRALACLLVALGAAHSAVAAEFLPASSSPSAVVELMNSNATTPAPTSMVEHVEQEVRDTATAAWGRAFELSGIIVGSVAAVALVVAIAYCACRPRVHNCFAWCCCAPAAAYYRVGDDASSSASSSSSSTDGTLPVGSPESAHALELQAVFAETLADARRQSASAAQSFSIGLDDDDDAEDEDDAALAEKISHLQSQTSSIFDLVPSHDVDGATDGAAFSTQAREFRRHATAEGESEGGL